VLNELRRRLKEMAMDQMDLYSQKVRELAGPGDAALFDEPLRQMILALPDMLGQIRQLVDEWPYITSMRRGLNYLLSYLHNPADCFPDYKDELFGYMDDAYLVALVYDWFVNTSAVCGVPMKPHNKQLADQLPQWIRLSRTLAPAETAYLDSLFESMKQGAYVGELELCGMSYGMIGGSDD